MKLALGAAVLVLGCATGGGASPGAGTQPAGAKQHQRPDAALQVVLPGGSARQPTTDAVILGRLEETLREIPAGSFAPRIAMADVAYPSSQSELDAVGSYAVLLVTVVSHDPNELPIDRVEIRSETKTAKLIEVGTHRSLLARPRLAEVFGQFRYDGIYLVPVSATRVDTAVTVFIGRGAYPLAVLRFPRDGDGETLPPDLVLGPVRRPDPEALRAMVEREFPLVAGDARQ
jgi:hypothetical protein